MQNLRNSGIATTRGWGHSGDLTADFAPVVGNLTLRFVKSPVFPTPRGGGGE